MNIGALLIHAHPEVMEMCEDCHGNGQYYVHYPRYDDPTPDVSPCEKCETLGYTLKYEYSVHSKQLSLRSY